MHSAKALGFKELMQVRAAAQYDERMWNALFGRSTKTHVPEPFRRAVVNALRHPPASPFLPALMTKPEAGL